MEQCQGSHPTQSGRTPCIRKVINVYLCLLCGLVITAVTIAILFQLSCLVKFVSNHMLVTIVVTALLMTLNINILNRISFEKHKEKKIIFWALNCVLASTPFVSADPWTLMKSIIYTVLLVIILTLKSFLIPEAAINSIIGPLSIIHTLVLMCSVYMTIFGSTSSFFSQIVSSIGLHGGFIVYSGLVVCNTQRVCLNAKNTQFDTFHSAFVFYMNLLNLYCRMVMFSSINYSALKSA
ncbi:hypothetical protein J6590_077767 [Homalodisca vitripennis]|nr:hypothetical protein J6590_077767 [Homalodisca vitripennis]